MKMHRRDKEKAVNALLEQVIAASFNDDLIDWLTKQPEPSLEDEETQWDLDAIPAGPMCKPVAEHKVAADEIPVVSGTKSITIRVPSRILQEFRKQSEKTGTAYQTLINRTLQDAVDAFA